MVVVATADIFVRRSGCRRLLGRWQRLLVEIVLEDREHVSVAPCASEEGTRARCVDARIAVLLGETEQTETRTVAPLRVPALAQDHLTQRARIETHSLCPLEDARRGSTPRAHDACSACAQDWSCDHCERDCARDR